MNSPFALRAVRYIRAAVDQLDEAYADLKIAERQEALKDNPVSALRNRVNRERARLVRLQRSLNQ